MSQVLTSVHFEGRRRAVALDLAGGRFRWLSPPEAALAPFLDGAAGAEEVVERAARAGLWFSRAFVREVLAGRLAGHAQGPEGRVAAGGQVAAGSHVAAGGSAVAGGGLAGLLPPPPRSSPGEPALAAGFLVHRGRPRASVPPREIALPLGRAWGDGTHPTTAMALEALRREAPAREEETPSRPSRLKAPAREEETPSRRSPLRAPEGPSLRSFVDVGCGSGILLCAAARLGVERRAGVEVDAGALAEVSETIEAEGAGAAEGSGAGAGVSGAEGEGRDAARGTLLVSSLDALEGAPPFDLAVLSIGFRIDAALLADVARIGRRVFVGALREGPEEASITDIARGAGLVPRVRYVCRAPPGPPGFGVWVALLLERAAGVGGGAAGEDAARRGVALAEVEVAAPPASSPLPTAPEPVAEGSLDVDPRARIEVLDAPLGTRIAIEIAEEIAAAWGLHRRVELSLGDT